MTEKMQASLFDLVFSLSNAMDLISKDMVNHHKRVAYIAMKISQQMGLSQKDIDMITLAAGLHDAGALSYQERVSAKKYEFNNAKEHAIVGYYLLRNFERMQGMADIVRYHHHYWNYGEGRQDNGNIVPIGSHIIHLADRVEILIQDDQEILGQTNSIFKIIKEQENIQFHPQIMKALESLKGREYFWLDIMSPALNQILASETGMSLDRLSINDMFGFARLFSQIIDFRSSFTATHTAGVAYTAEALAGYAGFSSEDMQTIRIAGYFHDLGKLAVPTEILDKSGPLNREETNVIRSHTYHTYRVLENIPGFKQATEWAAFHHEKLDGTGYPFGLKAGQIPLGARVVSVADVFTAITEKRPYRDGMEKDRAIRVLHNMVDSQALDETIVQLLLTNYDHIYETRVDVQKKAWEAYRNFGNRT